MTTAGKSKRRRRNRKADNAPRIYCQRQPGEPTPDEIRRACWAIQAGWSEGVRLRRLYRFDDEAESDQEPGWTAPTVSTRFEKGGSA